jgi:hypothetical protein
MKTVACLALGLATALPQTNVQVDVIAPRDSRVTVERATVPYSIALTNNSTHAITGLVAEWAAGGPPQTLLLGHYGFKEAVVPAKGMMVLNPPNDITVIPVSMDRGGRRVVGPTAPPLVSRVVISVPTVIFDDGTMIGEDRYNLVATIAARTELPAALAAAEAKWAVKKPDVYEFTYKRICFCPLPPPGKPGSEPIVFRVLNGVGYLQGAWADRPEAGQGLAPYSTVEKQFDYIRTELDKHPYRAEIVYDTDDGHPTRVYIDPLQNTADEEYGFTVMGFTSLTR